MYLNIKNFLLFFSLLALSAFSEAAEKNLICNPELKNISENTGLPAGWQRKMIPGLETICAFKLSPGPDGKKAVFLEWQDGGPRFGIEAPLKKFKVPESSFSLSASAKTDGECSAFLMVEILDKSGKIISEKKSEPFSSSQFKKIEMSFSTPENAADFRVFFFNEGHGSVSFSDLCLKEVEIKTGTEFPIQALCMPIDITKTFCREMPEFNTFENAPLPLSFLFKGMPLEGKTNSFVIEVPSDIRIPECFNAHPGLSQRREAPVNEHIMRNGLEYTRYIFKDPATFTILQPSWAYCRELTLVLLPQDTRNHAERSFKLFWYITAGELKSEENSFTVNLLPPMKKTPNPVKFQVFLWGTGNIEFSSIDILNAIAAVYEESAMNFRARNSGKAAEFDTVFEKRGWRMAETMTDYMHLHSVANGPGWDTLKKKIELSISDNEAVTPDRICPQYIINDPGFKAYFREKLLERLKGKGLKNGEPVYLDTEPWQPMEWCFCERCRRDFAAYCKLDKVPDVSSIKSRYRKAWRDFRCRNTADVIKMYCDVIRENYPDSKIMEYDYVVKFNQPNFRNYFYGVAKDPQLNEKYFDAHISSYYHYIDKDAFDMIDINVKNLKKDYWTIGAIDRVGIYLSSKEILAPEQCRMLLLASAASGAKGTGFFPGKFIDGKYFLAIDKAMTEIAVLEKFYMDGKRIDEDIKAKALPYFSKKITGEKKEIEIARPDWGKFTGCRAHLIDGKRLVSLFNYNPEMKVFFEISAVLSEGKYTIMDVSSEKRILPEDGKEYWTSEEIAKGFLLPVHPRDVRFIVIRPFVGTDTAISVSGTLENYRKSFRDECKKYPEMIVLPEALSSKELSINYDDSNEDKRIELTLSNTFQKLWLNPECGGILQGWKANGKVLCDPNSAGADTQKSMCWDYFWLPEELRQNGMESEPVKIEKIGIQDGSAFAVLKNILKKMPLEILKTYRINSSDNGFVLSYDIKNIGDKPLRFSFWSHNFVCPENGRSVIKVPLKDGEKILDEEKGSFVFVRSDAYHPGFKAINGILAGNLMTVSFPKRNSSINIEVNFSQLMAFYVWGQAQTTFEWMYDEVTLLPGNTWHTEIRYTLSAK